MLEGRISRRVMAKDVESQRGAGLEIRAGGENLDLHWRDFAWADRLPLPMGVPGTPQSAPLVIELAMLHTEPPLGDTIPVESGVPVEEDFVAIGIDLPQHDEDVHAVPAGRGSQQ